MPVLPGPSPKGRISDRREHLAGRRREGTTTPGRRRGSSTVALSVITSAMGWSSVDTVAGLDLPCHQFGLGRAFAHVGQTGNEVAAAGSGIRVSFAGLCGRARSWRALVAGWWAARHARRCYARRGSDAASVDPSRSRRLHGRAPGSPDFTAASRRACLQGLHHAGDGRGEFDRRLFGHHVDERLVLDHGVAGLTCHSTSSASASFADVGQPEDERPISRPHGLLQRFGQARRAGEVGPFEACG